MRRRTALISGNLIEWADIVLGIPDNYEFMDPDLVELLKARVAKIVGATASDEVRNPDTRNAR